MDQIRRPKRETHTHVGVSRRKISVFTALVSALVILFLQIGYPNPNPNNNHETEIRNKKPYESYEGLWHRPSLSLVLFILVKHDNTRRDCVCFFLFMHYY
jgi:hypothetical protein